MMPLIVRLSQALYPTDHTLIWRQFLDRSIEFKYLDYLDYLDYDADSYKGQLC